MGNVYTVSKDAITGTAAAYKEAAQEAGNIAAKGHIVKTAGGLTRDECNQLVQVEKNATLKCETMKEDLSSKLLDVARKLDIASWLAGAFFIAFLITLVILIVTGAKNKKKLDELRSPSSGTGDSQATWSFL